MRPNYSKNEQMKIMGVNGLQLEKKQYISNLYCFGLVVKVNSNYSQTVYKGNKANILQL